MNDRPENPHQLANFSWLIEDCLAGSAYPQSDEALADLARRGIRLVVNLNERPLGPTRLAEHGMVELHLPVRDFTAPSVEQLVRGVSAIEEAIAEGKRVVVHCGAGLGRTGTLLACYLVRQGTPADEAIARVRAARPGSIETEEQKTAIREYAERFGG